MNEEIDRIPKFIYLDMDRVKSITARMDEGYIKEKVEEQGETEEDSKTLTGAIKASIFGIGGSTTASTTKTESETKVVQETRGLHHYHYNILESMLEDQEGNWFHDLTDVKDARDIINEGDIVKISGDLQISDYKTTFDMIEGFFEGFTEMTGDMVKLDPEEFFEGVDNLNKPRGDQFEAIESIFSWFKSFLPAEYEEMITGQLENGETKFWSTLDREKLESSPTEIRANYEGNEIPNCTVIARVETITENMESPKGFDEPGSGNLDFEELHGMADELAIKMNMKVQYPEIAITPIAIYR